MVERSSTGEIPHARLIARAKERADLYPTSKDISLIAKVGREMKKPRTFEIKISSRRSLNGFPVAVMIAF